MNASLRYLLPLLVVYGCEFGQSVAPEEVTDSPCNQLVEFTCGDSLVTTDLPARFPLEQSRIAGVWDLVQACGGIAGTCHRPDADEETVVLAFELSSRYWLCRFDDILESGTYEFEAAKERPELHLSGGTPDSRPVTYWVDFDSPDTLWLDPGCCDQFGLQFAARTDE